MKLLLALSLLIGMEAAGQIETVPPVDNRFRITDTVWATPCCDTLWVLKEDTVRILMLVCDTATMEVGTNSIWQPMYGKNYFTVWQFGYMVRSFGYPRSYLDDRRRPLSKSIIVWQSIKL